MSDASISVVIRFYNHREFVRQALDSILAQTRDNLEIIAVDDGSTDGTQAELARYGNSISTVLLPSNQGPPVAGNKGAAQATGQYLAFLDGDDVFLPWMVEINTRIIKEFHPEIILGPMHWFEGEPPDFESAPREIRFVDYKDYFSKDRPIGASASAIVVRRTSFEKVGGWEIFPGDDFDLLWKLGTAGRVILILEPPTTLHRAHAKQTTQQTSRVLQIISELSENERRGKYPGGKARRLERKACVGGATFYWARLAIRRRSYAAASVLLFRNWSYVVAAGVVRLRHLQAGRRPTETLGRADK
jgi:glycosyltransferase involved in cell wall biosynthesis